MPVALQARGFGGKLTEVGCAARIAASFGLTGSLIFECCGASDFAVQQGARAAKMPQAEARSALTIIFGKKLVDGVERLQTVFLQQNHVRAFADLDPAPVWRMFQ
ncbi:hypothetical protein AB7M16_006888 [Bradyrhizobium sp. USDA 372]